jgi:predicted RNase H-like HicB family nuclease
MLHYPAKIRKSEGVYLVTFPDFETINTWGETLEHALKNAEESLNGCLESDFERGFQIPDPSGKKGRNSYDISVKPHIAVSIVLFNS